MTFGWQCYQREGRLYDARRSTSWRQIWTDQWSGHVLRSRVNCTSRASIPRDVSACDSLSDVVDCKDEPQGTLNAYSNSIPVGWSIWKKKWYTQPEVFTDTANPTKVYKLRDALYGLLEISSVCDLSYGELGWNDRRLFQGANKHDSYRCCLRDRFVGVLEQSAMG